MRRLSLLAAVLTLAALPFTSSAHALPTAGVASPAMTSNPTVKVWYGGGYGYGYGYGRRYGGYYRPYYGAYRYGYHRY